MELERGRISPTQLIILTLGFLMGSSLILNPGQEALNNSWLAILAGLLEAFIFVWVFTRLTSIYPNQTIVEINDIILGPYLGKIFSIFYIWFFFHIGSMVLRNFAGFFNTIMPATPMAVFLIFMILTCALAVNKGIEVIARSCQIVVPIMLLTFVLDTILIANKMDLSQLLPIMDIPLKEFVKASHTAASFPFGEVIAFVMVIAFLNKPGEANKSIYLGLILSGVIYSVSAIRNIAVLGGFLGTSVYPSYSVIRLINIGDILTRIDIVVAVNLLIIGYIYVSIVYYAAVLGTAQLFKMRSYQILIIPIGILMFDISLTQFDNCLENIFFTNEIYPFYSLPFEFLIPLFTLLVAKIRKFPQPEINAKKS